jgi:hypothetical protein
MRRTTFTILLSVFAAVSSGQITTTKVAPKIDKADTAPYDSTQNFLGKDVYKYQGQELYLKGKAESLRQYGYENFSLDYTKDKLSDKSNVYKCCDSYNSKYDELVGKYFKVLEIIKHPKAEESEYLYGKKFYFKLQEKETNDIVYYEYDSEFEHSFPFIVVGFFEKQKRLFVGKEFVFSNSEFEGATDIQTGKTVTIKIGQKWKCTDLTIEEKYYNLSLIFENSLGEKTANSYDRVLNVAYTAKEADNYKKKFGQENFDKILQGKVKIGMTKEMCKLSWGEPKDINETITSGKKSEQWVYSDNYLYFDNGILTVIQ